MMGGSGFQSTSPRGGRLTLSRDFDFSLGFQSTSPRGGRPGEAVTRNVDYNFNPRPHEGDDSTSDVSGSSDIISIHVPTRGTTLLALLDNREVDIFQSTSPRGGRLYIGQCRRTQERYFNPRPHEGDDPRPQAFPPQARRFQSTSPRGGRPAFPVSSGIISYFNPRPHEGDDIGCTSF